MSTEIPDLLSTEALAKEFADKSYKKRYKAIRSSLVGLISLSIRNVNEENIGY